MKTIDLIKKYGFVVGPRFKPGFPPHPRTGYYVYRDWVHADEDFSSMEQRPLAASSTIERAVEKAVAVMKRKGMERP